MKKHKDHDMVTAMSLPDQLPDPDWTEVKDLALQAAAFTMAGDMEKANDLYQYLSIEVMETLYGKNCIRTFIQSAMMNEKPESRIQLL